MKLLLQKKCKIFEHWGAPPTDPQNSPPLRISGYAPERRFYHNEYRLHYTVITNCNYIFVITFYLPSCLGQETAKGPFGLRVKLPPVYHTQRKLHTVPLIAERQAGKL